MKPQKQLGYSKISITTDWFVGTVCFGNTGHANKAIWKLVGYFSIYIICECVNM